MTTLCDSCARARRDCPIYPQQTENCVEHVPKTWNGYIQLAGRTHRQAEPVIPKGALAFTGQLHEIGSKWIRYAQSTSDSNDIAVAVWSAMREALDMQLPAVADATMLEAGCIKIERGLNCKVELTPSECALIWSRMSLACAKKGNN